MPLSRKVTRLIRSLLSMGFDPRIQAPTDASSEFNLVYKGATIGILSIRGGKWSFRYTEEFRRDGRIKPLMIFPDKDKTYESKELWPFFSMRIPSLKQPSIRAVVDDEHIDEHDQVKLLRRFGRRTISNPFELIAPESE
jgi:HipA-like protein